MSEFEHFSRSRDEILLINCVSPKDLVENILTHKFRAEDTGDTGATLSEYDTQLQKDDTCTSVPIDNLDTTVNSQLARARLV